MSTLLKSAAKLRFFFYIYKKLFTFFSISAILSSSHIKIVSLRAQTAIMAYNLSSFRILNTENYKKQK